MTVTLAPELAGLLARTGHAWPDADEDRLIALADGWGGLASTLDTVRADHAGTARTVLAHNSGAGIDAFGEWVSEFDQALQWLVEMCARMQALLVSLSRWVYEAKAAIVGALDDLARRIDQVERDLDDIPIVGEQSASWLDDTIGALVDGSRRIIGWILDTLTGPVIEQAVPALVGFGEAVKGVVQGLRKLVKGEVGADWPTTPSHTPLPQNVPRGPQATPRPRDSDTMRRSLRLENEAATAMAQAGYDVEQLRPPGTTATPDYLIEGKRFDCYAPTAPRARNIWSSVGNKIDRDQTDRVIININAPDIQVDVDELRRQFQDHPLPGLIEAKVIAPGGAIIDIYP